MSLLLTSEPEPLGTLSILSVHTSLTLLSYGIAPKFCEQDGKPRIEVFNPCDDSDDQKTPTAILFDDDYKFLDFGNSALQRYAQILEDSGTALLFQSVLSYID